MAIFFCFDKRDFCELDICSKCKFYNGNGTRGIFGHEADDLFKNIFGEDYDFLRVRMLVRADREGRCTISPASEFDIFIKENHYVKRVDAAVTDIQDREKVLHDVISILNKQLDEEKQVTQNVIDDFIDYVTRGSRIAAQYCANCCSDCVNGYEWYCGNNKACKEFYPEAAKKEE